MIPGLYYNLIRDLPFNLPGPDWRDIKKILALTRIIPKELLWLKILNKRFFKIPSEVLDLYLTYRPTPLVRAHNLESYLDLPERIAIYYKNESVSPTGSYKLNAAIPSVYFGKKAGYKRVVCATSAGQWGAAIAFAASIFGLKCKVYMVKSAYYNKPVRRDLIISYGAEVEPTPDDSPGLANSIAISDAVSTHSLFPMLHLEMFHGIIGSETKIECERLGIKPDIMIAPVGSGMNFVSFISSYLKDNIVKKLNIEFLGIESNLASKLTKGKYVRASYDSMGLSLPVQAYSLDSNVVLGEMAAEGLRVSSASVLLSALYHNKMVKIQSYEEKAAINSGDIFAGTERICPAPESSYAIAAVIDRALLAKERKEKATILFNLSGHGLLDKNPDNDGKQ